MINSAFIITVALLVMCTVDEAFSYRTDCKMTPYEGPPGQVIASFKPTLPGCVSLDSSSDIWAIAGDIFGNVPVIGSAIGSIFDIIGIATDTTVSNMQMLEDAINKLIDSITKTVHDLKNYVDAKFDEYDYDKKVETLHGIQYAAGYCASFGLPDNQEDCLKSLNVDIVELVPVFFPVDPKYQTFEQLLPLTRHYIDLQMAVLVDIIGLTDRDQDYVDSIATFSIMAYNFYITTVETICDEHMVAIDDNDPHSCSQHNIDETGWYCFYENVKCVKEWDHGDGCAAYFPPALGKYSYSCDDWSRYMQFVNGATWELVWGLNGLNFSYCPQLHQALQNYWKTEIGQAMEKYKQIGIEAGASENDFLVMAGPTDRCIQYPHRNLSMQNRNYESYIPKIKILAQKLKENSMKYLKKSEQKLNHYSKQPKMPPQNTPHEKPCQAD